MGPSCSLSFKDVMFLVASCQSQDLMSFLRVCWRRLSDISVVDDVKIIVFLKNCMTSLLSSLLVVMRKVW